VENECTENFNCIYTSVSGNASGQMIISLIKFLIGVLGVVTTIVYVVKALGKNRNRNFKTALAVLFTTGGLLVLLTTIEFITHDKSKDYSQKKTSLVAMREASAGNGIHLRVYADSTYELGSGTEVKTRGEIKINADTLFLLKNEKIDKSFILDNGALLEIKNSGINFLEIESNELVGVK
jgi:hypothetical protein